MVPNGIKTSEKIFNKIVSQIVNGRTEFKSNNIYEVNNRNLVSYAPPLNSSYKHAPTEVSNWMI